MRIKNMEQNEKPKKEGLSYEDLSERGKERITRLKEALTEARKYGWSIEVRHAIDDLDKALDKLLGQVK